MRHATEPRTLWADQVCIDQDKLIERGHQVKLMGQIYRNTIKVLVWLGRDEENLARLALDMFKALRTIFRDESQLKKFTEDQRERPETFDDGSWRPLRRFYYLPWFKRVWVGQEAGTGAPMDLFWGQERFDWKPVFFVSQTLELIHEPLINRYHLRPSRVINLHRRFVTPVNGKEQEYYRKASFVYELHRSRRKKASDPRDRIFAKLGHFSAAVLLQCSPRFEADYTRTTADIHTDVAVRTLRGYPTLELLNAVQHYNDDKNLPSWVPDWGAESSRDLLGARGIQFRAARDTIPSFNIHENEKILEVKGLEMDAIEISSRELNSKDFDFKHLQHSQAGDSVVLRIWNDICQLFTFGLEHRYVSGESSVLAFCQVLTAGCSKLTAPGRALRSDYHSLSSDTGLRYGAAYLTRVFGDTGLVHGDVEQAGQGGDAFAWNGAASIACRRRSFFRTVKGYYGLGPSEMEKDDVIVVLFGGTTPYVLRPTSQGYAFVGECYVYGLMNGEAIAMMERGELKEKTFVTR